MALSITARICLWYDQLQVKNAVDPVQQLQYLWRALAKDLEAKSHLLLLIIDDSSGNQEGRMAEAEICQEIIYSNCFRRIIIQREEAGIFDESLDLECLKEEDSLNLLAHTCGFSGEDRITREIQAARQLTEAVGYLPLGIVQIGAYLSQLPYVRIADLLSKIHANKLIDVLPTLSSDNEAVSQRLIINNPFPKGISAAFLPSWTQLSLDAKILAIFLSYFWWSPIPWQVLQTSAMLCIHMSQKKMSDIDLQKIDSIVNGYSNVVDSLDNGRFQAAIISLINYRFINKKTSWSFEIHPIVAQFIQFQVRSEELPEDQILFIFICLGASLEQQMAGSIEEEIIAKWFSRAVKHVMPGALARFQDKQSSSDFWVGVTDDEKEIIIRYTKILAKTCASTDNFKNNELSQLNLDMRSELEDMIIDLCENYARSEVSIFSPLMLYRNAARFYAANGNYLKAETLYKKACETDNLGSINSQRNMASLLEEMSVMYRDWHKIQMAISVIKQSLQIWKDILGLNHSYLASVHCKLGNLYFLQGCTDLAKKEFDQAIILACNLDASPHIDFFSDIAIKASSFYGALNFLSLAEDLLLQAKRKYISSDLTTPTTAQVYRCLGALKCQQRKYYRSEIYYHDALTIYLDIPDYEYRGVAWTYLDLADLHSSKGAHIRAKVYCDKALDLYNLIYKSSRIPYDILKDLSVQFTKAHDFQASEKLLVQRMKIAKEANDDESDLYAEAMLDLGAFYLSRNKYEYYLLASPLIKGAIDIFIMQDGYHHPRSIQLLSIFGIVILQAKTI